MIKRKGFTLVEILVVIAIIGILASVVLASMGGARSKGRDTKRISDVKQLQLALQLYYDANVNKYPAALTSLTTSGFISSIPTDPDGTDYLYRPLSGGSACSSNCTDYVLATQLENPEPDPGYNSDYDLGSGLNCDDPNVYCGKPI